MHTWELVWFIICDINYVCGMLRAVMPMCWPSTRRETCRMTCVRIFLRWMSLSPRWPREACKHCHLSVIFATRCYAPAPSNRIWNITILRSPKQQIWLRTALCGGWCRRIALRNRELHDRNDDAMLCKHGLCCRAVSVHLSVCPSKRVNIKLFSLSVATLFLFFHTKRHGNIPTETP